MEQMKLQLQGEIKQSQAEMEQVFEVEFTKLRARIGKAEGDIGKLKGDIGKLKSHIGKLKGHIGIAQSEIEDQHIRSRLQRLENEMAVVKGIVVGRYNRQENKDQQRQEVN